MEEKKKNYLQFNPIRVLKALLLVFIFFLILFLLIPCRCHIHAFRVLCSANIHQLGIGMVSYKSETGLYPSSNNWCDSIKVFLDEEANYYLCRDDKTGPCSYALNENIPADAEALPGDLVLLFESIPGWNQTGGIRDVVTDRHGRPGANIAFADGHVEFVEAEEISNLRWTLEEK